MGSDDVLESVLGLGDLADLTVSNDDADYGYDVSGPACIECFHDVLPNSGRCIALHAKAPRISRDSLMYILYSWPSKSKNLFRPKEFLMVKSFLLQTGTDCYESLTHEAPFITILIRHLRAECFALFSSSTFIYI